MKSGGYLAVKPVLKAIEFIKKCPRNAFLIIWTYNEPYTNNCKNDNLIKALVKIGCSG